MAPTTISTKLRRARKTARLSQQQVATLAGCSVATIRLYESGYVPDSELPARILTMLEGEAATP